MLWLWVVSGALIAWQLFELRKWKGNDQRTKSERAAHRAYVASPQYSRDKDRLAELYTEDPRDGYDWKKDFGS